MQVRRTSHAYLPLRQSLSLQRPRYHDIQYRIPNDLP